VDLVFSCSKLGWNCIHRLIHKSLRDFRPSRYSGRDDHDEGEHVNRGRGTPCFCSALQVLDVSTLGDISNTWQTFLGHARQSRPMASAGLFDSLTQDSKTQNTFFFSLHAMFRHDSPLVVKSASTPRRLVHKKLEEILYLFIWSFLLCLSLLLRSRVRNFWRDLRIILYSSKTEYWSCMLLCSRFHLFESWVLYILSTFEK
jgi:hypothetical protein